MDGGHKLISVSWLSLKLVISIFLPIGMLFPLLIYIPEHFTWSTQKGITVEWWIQGYQFLCQDIAWKTEQCGRRRREAWSWRAWKVEVEFRTASRRCSQCWLGHTWSWAQSSGPEPTLLNSTLQGKVRKSFSCRWRWGSFFSPPTALSQLTLLVMGSHTP